MEIEILYGGSGQWAGREVKSRWPNGRVAEWGEQWFFGHVPRGAPVNEIVPRQIRRQLAGESPYHQRKLKGGHIYEIHM